jgi:hypothetical protein
MDRDKTHLFDVRTVERNIAKGFITREEADAFAADVEDCSELCEPATTRLVKHARIRTGTLHLDDGE